LQHIRNLHGGKQVRARGYASMYVLHVRYELSYILLLPFPIYEQARNKTAPLRYLENSILVE